MKFSAKAEQYFTQSLNAAVGVAELEARILAKAKTQGLEAVILNGEILLRRPVDLNKIKSENGLK